ncbi:MAG TPA: aspartate aminotransferase family protein [Candidatus Polarisedimenticolia bacterium]|nr:aspartate aminotransferase family protein [Candidatus Polarisedimenticolia bacterium]
MKRSSPSHSRRRSRSRKPRGASRRAPGKRRGKKLVLAAQAIAVATAKAAASLKSTLADEPVIAADDVIDEAINEAEEINLLLDEGEEEGPEPLDEEDQYFLKGTGSTRSRPRVRPAPAIAAKGGPAPDATGRGVRAAAPEAGAASGAAPVAPHLFPRNLRTRYPIAVKAAGVWIHDSEGRKYLDGCSGAVVCSIGHGVPEIAAVMTAQAKRLAFAHSSQFISHETIGLSERIAALCPGDLRTGGRVYLVSGGSEAVETAIKLARQYHLDSGNPGKHKVIARWQSYHGSTMGALAVTGNVARRDLYAPMFATMPHIPPCYCYRCPYTLKFPACGIACVEDLEAAIHQEGPETVAAFIAEPVVGATLGAVPAVEGYWNRAREICDRYNVLLIADEVMTGIGRTGKNFAVDHYKVVPDLIVTGKGLSGGYTPLGAVIARGFIADALAAGRGYFEHGFTYSANPLSAAIGSAVLDYVAKNRLVARAARFGKVLGEKLETLRRHRIVGDVRGLGMMWGIELVRDRKTREPLAPGLKASRRLYDACLAEGLIIYPGSGTREGQDGDHFIVSPPFTITSAEIDDLVARLDRALVKTAASLR